MGVGGHRGRSGSVAPRKVAIVVKVDGDICGGVLVENASDDFPQQKKLENLLPNFAGSSPPISPKTSPTSLWKSRWCLLSEAFYADAVRRVNLLTLAFALYFPAFER